MNSKQIRTLRRHFIIVAMISICIAMMFIGIMINITSYVISMRGIHETLEYLTETMGESMEEEDLEDLFSDPSMTGALQPSYRHNRFFVVKYDSDGQEIQSVSSAYDQVVSESAIGTAASILDNRDGFGRLGKYYYQKQTDEEGNIILAFLDGTTEMNTVARLQYATIALGFFGMLISFFLVRHFSKPVVASAIDNAVRQEQFITNASHELKTPLAVIRANTELLEMMNGESEWSKSTLNQVDRMNGLIQNLVMITRAQEQEDDKAKTLVDVTASVNATVDPYEAMASQSGKTITRQVNENVTLKANESQIRQLVSLLVDNAMKYCDEGGEIMVGLESIKNGKGVTLTVSNDYAEGASVDYKRFFDRFYRADQAHNIDSGGYGIGLSIAESICRHYNGTISADWKDGRIAFVCKLY